MKLRAYLVDDEPLAVERLRRLLEQTGRVDVTGSSTEPEQAVAALTGDPPGRVLPRHPNAAAEWLRCLGEIASPANRDLYHGIRSVRDQGICCEFYRLSADADRARSRESSDRGRGIWAEALSIAGS